MNEIMYNGNTIIVYTPSVRSAELILTDEVCCYVEGGTVYIVEGKNHDYPKGVKIKLPIQQTILFEVNNPNEL